MKIRHWLAMTMLLLGVTAAPLASAVERGGYFGIATGEAEGDTRVSDFSDGSITSGSVDDTDSGVKLFGGFQFTNNLAVEGGLIDFGEVTFDGVSNGSVPLGFAAGPVTANIETAGVYAAIVGMKSFLRVSVFGKLGLLLWGADGEFVDSVDTFDLDEEDVEESGESVMVGIGVEYRPTKKIGIRGEWERYQDALADERDIDLLSVSVVFRR